MLKKKLVIALAISLGLALGGPSARALTIQDIINFQTGGQILGTTEYLVNSSFEQADSNNKPLSWSDNGFTLDSAVSRTGSRSLKITNSNLIPYSQSASQTVALLPRGTYSIGLWVKMSNLAANQGGMRISLNTGTWPNTCQNGCGTSSIIKGTSDWQYLEKQNIAITNDSTAYFIIEMYGEPDGIAWFDDAAITDYLGPDTTAPVVSVTAPAAGAAITGTTSLTASATDNVAVSGVQFKVDGSNVGAEITSPPYSVSWDSATASNGSHQLTAVARDSAGNTAASTAVAITTSNADAVPPTISSVASGPITGSGATITWTTNEQANSQVEFGTAAAYGNTSALDNGFVTSHAVNLSGLADGTLYHYRVKSADSSGNLSVSGDFTFTTPAMPGSQPQCSDGDDNDLDGKADYPEDPGCTNASDADEFNAPAPPAAVNGLVSGGLLWYPAARLGQNLLSNPGLEQVDANGKPANWNGSSAFALDNTVGHNSANSYRLKDAPAFPYSENGFQSINLKKGSYRIGGWIKTELQDSSIHPCVRLTLSTANEGGGTSKCLGVINDWTYVELKSIAITQDTAAKFNLNAWNDPAGSAWFDDLELHEEYQPPIDVFMLYPNYRGYLFDDQSQNLKFDITVNPPAGTVLSDWKAEVSILDESNNSVVVSQAYSAAANFSAALNGSSLLSGRTYLARFRLLRSSNSQPVYEYPPYRISKVSGSVRSGMSVSFDGDNRILFNGQPKFLLGVYDSGLGYSNAESSWETMLFSDTGSRRMNGLPINFYNNYWYGGASVTSMQAMSNVLQRRGIYFAHTGNCFGSGSAGLDFLIYTDPAYRAGIGGIAGNAGFYTMDECAPQLAPSVFEASQKLWQAKPGGITFGAGNTPTSMHYWRDAVDLLSMDPYPLYSTEPAGGYNLSSGSMGVADWTRITKDAVKNSRPVATVLQFFKATSLGRWPTQAELRNMSYMAIAEGSNGLVYWSIGTNALAYICNGSSDYYSPSGSTSWCQAKVDNMNNLKAVVTELDSLQPALSSVDRSDLLAANSNGSIHTRVKYANGKGYLIASNYTGSAASATFTWSQTPSLVSVYNEARSLNASGSSFTDSFGPYQAHVYEISTGAVPAPVITSFTASPSTVTGGGSATLSWTVSGATALSIDQGIGTVTGSSKTVTPAQTATYTLTASNASGSATKSATVTVTNPLPMISNLVGSSITATSAIISWQTNIATNGQIFYGPTASLGLQSALLNDSPKTLAHSTALTNLTPAATYHFQVSSTDSNNNSTTTPVFTFTTLSLPVPASASSSSTPPASLNPADNPGSAGDNSTTSPATSTPDIIFIPPLATTTPANSPSLRLVDHNGTYYLIKNDQRFGITSPGILFSYGFDFVDAKPAASADISLPQGDLLLPGDGYLVKSRPDPTVWLISSGRRYGFVSEAVFKALGFDFRRVLLVTDPELQALPKASNLDNPSSAHLPGLDINDNGTIYWIAPDNTKQGYPSMAVYNSWHKDNDFSQVVPANAADKALPSGGIVKERVME